MSAIRVLSLGMVALCLGGLSAARGAEVVADPVCRSCGPTTAYRPVTVYQPYTAYRVDPCCENVGPVRRLLRRVFRPCCPPAPCCSPVPVVRYGPVVAPCPPSLPMTWAPPAPVMLDRPIPSQPPLSPPPPIDVPSSSNSLRRDGVLTPPTPPTPVRLDRIASRQGDESTVRAKAESRNVVTLVQVGNPDSRRQVEADAAGRIRVELTPGTWVLSVKDATGKSVEQGRLVIRARKIVQVRIIES